MHYETVRSRSNGESPGQGTADVLASDQLDDSSFALESEDEGGESEGELDQHDNNAQMALTNGETDGPLVRRATPPFAFNVSHSDTTLDGAG